MLFNPLCKLLEMEKKSFLIYTLAASVRKFDLNFPQNLKILENISLCFNKDVQNRNLQEEETRLRKYLSLPNTYFAVHDLLDELAINIVYPNTN